MFVSIPFPMHSKLCSPSSFSVLSDFFYFILFFLIDNVWWWCQFHVLTLKLWFLALCQQVLIKHTVYYLFFWKFQLKHSLTNVLWDCKRSISFLVWLLWGLVWMYIFGFQLHVVSYLQSLWILPFLVKLSFHNFFCYFYQLHSFFPTSLQSTEKFCLHCQILFPWVSSKVEFKWGVFRYCMFFIIVLEFHYC